MKLLTKVKIATALALVVTINTTVADTMTQTRYFDMGKNSPSYDTYQPIVFTEFDPSLGSLRSLSVSLDSAISYDRTYSTWTSLSGWTSLNVEVRQGDLYNGNLLARGSSSRYDSGNSWIGNPMQFQITSDVNVEDILSGFTGTGMASVIVMYSLVTDNSAPSDYWHYSNFFGNVALSYSYDPPPPAAVPESGSIAFLGIGITGLVVYGGRRKKAEQGSRIDS